MFTIKHQIEGLIALHSAEYERRRAEFPALVRALEAGSAKSIEVEVTCPRFFEPVILWKWLGWVGDRWVDRAV